MNNIQIMQAQLLTKWTHGKKRQEECSSLFAKCSYFPCEWNLKVSANHVRNIYIYTNMFFVLCVYYNFDIYTHTHLKECPRVLDPGCVPCCSRSKLGQQSFCKCGGPKNHRTKSAGWPNYLGTGCLVPTHDWGGCVNMYASAYQRRITPRWIEASSFFSSVASFLIAQSCVEVLKLPLLDRRVRRERPGARMLFLAQWGLRGRKISRSWQAEKKNEAHKRSQK